MRKEIILFFLIISYFSIRGQQNLSDSRRTSIYTYIYQVNQKQTVDLFKSGMNTFTDEYLHTLIDSFLTTGRKAPLLQKGNYLFIHAAGNHIEGELTTIDDLQYKLLNNNRDFIIILHNKSGQSIYNASVFINKKRIPFDKEIQAFRLPNRKKRGTIRIYHEGVLHQFALAKNYYHYRGNFIQNLANAFPLKFIVKPIKQLLHRSDYYYYFKDKVRYEKKFTGFMVFNKPIYKPGDTVKLKAYILTKNKKPINRPLLLRLTEDGFGIDSVIAIVNPYRPGAFEYQFIINDSLDLSLDDRYMLTMEELSSRRYTLDMYEGDLDDEEYAQKRKILMRGNFKYEEYELNTVTFTARSDKKENNRGNPASVYLKATDENDMTVLDGRVEIVVTSLYNKNIDFHQNVLYLPDTLWHHSKAMDPIGETKITLPDSIFPPASFSYQVECIFLNSNNELQSKIVEQQYNYNPCKIYIQQQGDSLFIKQMNAFRTDAVLATIVAFTNGEDTIAKQIICLPASVAINPFATYYQIKTANANEQYSLLQKNGMINCVALRTKDSIAIQVNNPNKLFFRYTLFAGNEVIKKGYSDKLILHEKTKTSKNYFISLQYIYGNKSYSENYAAAYQDKLLTVQAEQPPFVYPGQTANITVNVTNAIGKPVQDADVTAYAVTKKFTENMVPYVPYLGKRYPDGKGRQNFYIDNRRMEEKNGITFLNWKRWSKEMNLDSIEYYKFLYTPSIYRNTEPAKDSITQIAPFVVLNGEIQPIHQIYIDEQPVFFSQSHQLQRYSFFVRPGKHSLRIRTHNLLIRIDSIWARSGCKTFFSINADTTLNKMIRINKMPDTLTVYEKNLWSKYMFLVENNFGENYSYIKHNDRVSLLNRPLTNSRPTDNNFLVGPLPDFFATLVVKNKFEQVFEPEGNYLFSITQGLIKQKQLPLQRYSFNSHLGISAPDYNFNDFVLTEKEIDSLWLDYLDHRSANENLFRNRELNKYQNGRLVIDIKKYRENELPFIKNIFLLRYDDLDFLRLYSGISRDLGYIQPGLYRLLILLKGNTYYIRDSLLIKANGTNYYSTEINEQLPEDSVSNRIANIINGRELKYIHTQQEVDLNNIRESFNEKFLKESILTRIIFGRVKEAKTGNLLAGASIYIKGTNIGVMSDKQGYFSLKVPPRGTLIISAIGFTSIEKRLSNEDNYEFSLYESSQNLSEVVVTGYGTVRNKKELSFSVSSVSDITGSMLMGKAAGVTISIRGTRTLNNNQRPLYVVDGLPYTEDILKLDSSIIESVTVLKGSEASEMFGSAGVNGVILISTKKSSSSKELMLENSPLVSGSSIRKNFKDDAFWQPRLRTDAEGKVSFRVTFPDDITNWRTFFIAMNGKESGFAEQQIKSFKLLSTSLATPLFFIYGDSANIIGKTLSYSIDSIQVYRSFSINKNSIQQKQILFKNSWIDTFSIKTTATDSISFSYSIQKQNGYLDGEERSVPVFNQGVSESAGLFAVLERDTTFTYQPKDSNTTIKIFAESSVLPVLLSEIESIRSYEYLCNEQLASKLKALLLKRKIYKYSKKVFKEEKNISELIAKLNQGKGRSGLWGWWNNNELSLWISLHAIEALLQAEQDGYIIYINKSMLIDYLVLNLESYRGIDKISCIHILRLLKAKVDFEKYISSEEKQVAGKSFYEKLRLIQLKQELNMPVLLDSLIQKANKTIFGNLYWGEENYRFFDNSIQNTLLMYCLMRKQGGYGALLEKVRNYFFEKRKSGNWRNTYESALILETIIPDLLVNDTLPNPPSIQINGGKPVQLFPYITELKAGEKISIQKEGKLPVYFTAYQQYWNHAPEKATGDFIVHSYFEKSGEQKTFLKAGEPIELKIKISVKSDADYIMIEIPIPAGCSYKDKIQPYSNNEVHREYLKNKVNIFCNSLRKGEYVFSVSLLPRFTGKYFLNPAKAEMMYFPVFFGREEMKKIDIR